MKQLVDIFDRHASKIKNIVLPAMVTTFAFNYIAQPDLPLMAVSLGAGVAASFAGAIALRPDGPKVLVDIPTLFASGAVTGGLLYSTNLMLSLMP